MITSRGSTNPALHKYSCDLLKLTLIAWGHVKLTVCDICRFLKCRPTSAAIMQWVHDEIKVKVTVILNGRKQGSKSLGTVKQDQRRDVRC